MIDLVSSCEHIGCKHRHDYAAILVDDLLQRELDCGPLVVPFNQRLNVYGYAVQPFWGRLVSRSALRKWLIDHV
ncbi:MAG: hypothetical protein GY896_16330 [Gammaproteobacteria bacterium]|nr:hypothetical protein [Gammaproteobacteria bacterium]